MPRKAKGVQVSRRDPSCCGWFDVSSAVGFLLYIDPKSGREHRLFMTRKENWIRNAWGKNESFDVYWRIEEKEAVTLLARYCPYDQDIPSRLKETVQDAFSSKEL